MREGLYSFYKPLYEAHVPVDFAHPGSDLSSYNLVIAPNLYLVTDDVDVAVQEIDRFWRSYHSIRWVGGRLVVRLRYAPDDCAYGASWSQPTDHERLTLQTSQGYNRNWGELVVIAEPAP